MRKEDLQNDWMQINEIVERKRKERSLQMSKSPYTYDHTLGIDNGRDFIKAIMQECTNLYKIHHKSKDNHVMLSISWHQCKWSGLEEEAEIIQPCIFLLALSAVLCFCSFSFYTMQEKTPTTLVDKLANSPYPIWSLSALCKRLQDNSDKRRSENDTPADWWWCYWKHVPVYHSLLRRYPVCHPCFKLWHSLPSLQVQGKCCYGCIADPSMYWNVASYVTHVGDAENGSGIATGELYSWRKHQSY